MERETQRRPYISRDRLSLPAAGPVGWLRPCDSRPNQGAESRVTCPYMVIIVESKFQGLGGVIVDLAVELLPEGRKEGRKEGRREGDQTQGKRHGPLSLAEGGGGGTQLELHSERQPNTHKACTCGGSPEPRAARRTKPPPGLPPLGSGNPDSTHIH